MCIDRLLADFSVANKGAVSPEERLARFVEAQPVNGGCSQLCCSFEVLLDLRRAQSKDTLVQVTSRMPKPIAKNATYAAQLRAVARSSYSTHLQLLQLAVPRNQGASYCSARCLRSCKVGSRSRNAVAVVKEGRAPAGAAYVSRWQKGRRHTIHWRLPVP